METTPMIATVIVKAAGPGRRRLAEASSWDTLLAAYRLALARSQRLGRACLAAEEASFAAKRARRLVPAPVELVRDELLPVVRMIDGKTRILPVAEAVLATEAAIRSFAGAGGRLSEKLRAL